MNIKLWGFQILFFCCDKHLLLASNFLHWAWTTNCWISWMTSFILVQVFCLYLGCLTLLHVFRCQSKCRQIEVKDSYFGSYPCEVYLLSSVDHILGIHVSNFTGQNVWIFPQEPLLFLCLFPGVHVAQDKSCWEGNVFKENVPCLLLQASIDSPSVGLLLTV